MSGDAIQAWEGSAAARSGVPSRATGGGVSPSQAVVRTKRPKRRHQPGICAPDSPSRTAMRRQPSRSVSVSTASPEAIDLARRKVPGADIYESDICDPEIRSDGFDLIAFGLPLAVLPLLPQTHHWWESNLNRLIVALICGGATLA